jgi:hypothetical protein
LRWIVAAGLSLFFQGILIRDEYREGGCDGERGREELLIHTADEIFLIEETEDTNVGVGDRGEDESVEN